MCYNVHIQFTSVRYHYHVRQVFPMQLRPMTALYLLRGDQVLLLYRMGSSVISDSYTGAAGGHMEADEYRSPRACVLRELREETGLTEADLTDLRLRYITLRNKNGEIRENYYYFARLNDDVSVQDSNEGRLEWHALSALDGLPMPVTARHVIDHYLAAGRFDDKLYGGITSGGRTVFNELDDF